MADKEYFIANGIIKKFKDLLNGSHAEVTASVGLVLASDGVLLPIDDLATTNTPDGNGRLSYTQVVYDGVTYRKTYTYSGDFLTNISNWVKQ